MANGHSLLVPHQVLEKSLQIRYHVKQNHDGMALDSISSILSDDNFKNPKLQNFNKVHEKNRQYLKEMYNTSRDPKEIYFKKLKENNKKIIITKSDFHTSNSYVLPLDRTLGSI